MCTLHKIDGCENLKRNSVHAHVNLQPTKMFSHIHRPKRHSKHGNGCNNYPKKKSLPSLKVLLNNLTLIRLPRKILLPIHPSIPPYRHRCIHYITPKGMRRFGLKILHRIGLIEGVLPGNLNPSVDKHQCAPSFKIDGCELSYAHALLQPYPIAFTNTVTQKAC